MAVILTLHCDNQGCKAMIVVVAESVRGCRIEARSADWTVNEPDGDWCSACKEETG